MQLVAPWWLAMGAACTVSDDAEVSLGRDASKQIDAQVPILTDPESNAYIVALGNRIASKTSRADLRWTFSIVNVKDVNAFALPGGFVYVNRGLIERTKSLDELAGVLGHEIGHVVRRHSVEQMKKATGTNLGVAIVCNFTSICDSRVAQVAINVGGSALFAKYSRQDEIEADSEAVANVVRAGIDPRGIPSMFETLMRERHSSPTIIDAFFSSHPIEENRIRATKALVDAIPPAILSSLVSNDEDFTRFKARLVSLPPPPKTIPR